MRETSAIRQAKKADVAHLAVLMDIASQGLVSQVWGKLATAGQSPLELGRMRICELVDLPSHYSRWSVFENENGICGAYAGYLIADPYDPGDVTELPPAYFPLLELEALAKGSWFLTAIAVYPEYRGKGIGRLLLHSAALQAQASGVALSLTVSKQNTVAKRMYVNAGFQELARRKRVDSAATNDEWLLLVKA